MKTKILESLKTRYKTLGFSDKAFNGVADYLAKTVTDETNIETSTEGVEGLLKAFQGDYDRLRNEMAELKKNVKTEPKPDTKPGEGEKKYLTVEEVEEMFKAREAAAQAARLFESNKAAVIEKLKTKGLKASLLTKLASTIKDESMSVEDMETLLQSDYDEAISELSPEAGRPTGGGGVSGANLSSELEAWRTGKKAEIEKTTKTA